MSEQVHIYHCNEIGLTMGAITTLQLPDGSWKATCQIGSIFGSEVEGQCHGAGPTKEAALAALAEERRQLSESLWY